MPRLGTADGKLGTGARHLARRAARRYLPWLAAEGLFSPAGAEGRIKLSVYGQFHPWQGEGAR